MSLINKLEIADEMLDASIEEYLDKKRPCAALNLACVAQEIYGKSIRIENGIDTMSMVASKSFDIYKESHATETTLKEFKTISALIKNGVKHLDSKSDMYLDFNPNIEARLMIAIAINDKVKANRPASNWDARFKEFATIYAWHNT